MRIMTDNWDADSEEYSEQIREAKNKGELRTIFAVPVFDGYFATDDSDKIISHYGERWYPSISHAEKDLSKSGVQIQWDMKDASLIPVNQFKAAT